MFGFFKNLGENRLLRLKKVGAFNARDISDLAFLYILTLYVLRSEFETAPFAQQYAQQTNRHSGYAAVDPGNTDLYQFLHILSDQHGAMANRLADGEANELFWPTLGFSATTVRQILNELGSKRFDGGNARRLLLKLEQQLHITNSNYRSMRRLVGEWNTGDLDTHQKQLVVTRMLQALRARAYQGDVLPRLELLAGRHGLELLGAADAETGQQPHKGLVSNDTKDALKGLAVAAGIYAVNRYLMNKKSGVPPWRGDL